MEDNTYKQPLKTFPKVGLGIDSIKVKMSNSNFRLNKNIFWLSISTCITYVLNRVDPNNISLKLSGYKRSHGHRTTTNSNIVAAVTKRERIPYYNMVVRLSWKRAIILSIFLLPTWYLWKFKKYIPTSNPPSMKLTRPEKGLNELGVGERLIEHPYPEECFLDLTTLSLMAE
jgi:hypothetical protein